MRNTIRLTFLLCVISLFANAQWRLSPYNYYYYGIRVDSLLFNSLTTASGSYTSLARNASGKVVGYNITDSLTKRALLDGSGKLYISQIPDALVGAVVYQGNYNASTNSPALPSSTGNKGNYWVVSTAGTQFGLTLSAGDWIISNGSIYQKVDNNNAVTSVAGRTGAVVIDTGDIASFSFKVRSRINSGNGISYASSTGAISNTAGLNFVTANDSASSHKISIFTTEKSEALNIGGNIFFNLGGTLPSPVAALPFGIKWHANTDTASIYMTSSGDLDGSSNMVFQMGDNITAAGGRREGWIFRKSGTGDSPAGGIVEVMRLNMDSTIISSMLRINSPGSLSALFSGRIQAADAVGGTELPTWQQTIQNQNTSSQSANSWISGIHRVGTSTSGYVTLNAGGATATGWIGFYKNDGTRLGFIGSSPSVINYMSENGATHVFTGGGVGIGNTPTSSMDITGTNGYNQLRMRTTYTPTATSDTNGNTGDVAWDANYIYIKTSAGWKRAALTTF